MSLVSYSFLESLLKSLHMKQRIKHSFCRGRAPGFDKLQRLEDCLFYFSWLIIDLSSKLFHSFRRKVEVLIKNEKVASLRRK